MKSYLATLCCVGLVGCGDLNLGAEDAPEVFPSVSRANVNTFNTTPCTANPTSRSENRRTGPVTIAGAFNGHVVKVCQDGEIVENVVFWSRTNEAGTNIEGIVTTLDGQRYQQSADETNQPNGTNYFNFATRTSTGSPLTCTIVKPPGGIAPASLALCQT